MRIIAGTLRGKVLKTPDSEAITRPTSDRAREMLFDILTSRLLKDGKTWAEITFADVFAGTGAIGIEALSRGAKSVFFFENDSQIRQILACNTKGLTSVFLEQDALTPPKHTPVSIVFMDAPYGKNLWQQALKSFDEAGWLDKETLIIVETDKKLKEKLPAGYTELRCCSAGRNTFILGRKEY